jgi:hypothetical protein
LPFSKTGIFWGKYSTPFAHNTADFSEKKGKYGETFPFAGGSGTEAELYLVATAEQLNNIRNYLDKHFKQTADIDLKDYSPTEGWEPIGLSKEPFIGSFDGNGFRIISLTISRSSDKTFLFGIGTPVVGLFGYNDGTLKNIALERMDIKGKDAIGSLAGINSGRITNSYATGKIVGEKWIGGLVGANFEGDIIKSYVIGEVEGELGIGGLVGAIWGGSITRSYVTGSVKGKEVVGGLVGVNSDDGSIENSYARAKVEGTKCVGGLVGMNDYDAIIKYSYSAGTVKGKNETGGLVGMNEGAVIAGYYDTETTGQTDTGKGIPAATAEMKLQTLYNGWDFINIWAIDDSKNDGYPYLKMSGH